MNHFKTLSSAALTVALAAACLAALAPAASGTALCKAKESPCSAINRYPKETKFKAESGVMTLTRTWESLTTTVECQSSRIWCSTLTAGGGIGIPVEAKTAVSTPAKAGSMSAVASWQAAKGQSLHDTLAAWCGRSGVNLIWEAKKDYKLPRTVDTKGTFTDAVLKVLTQYNGAKPRPVGQLHPNQPDGPPVLVIASEAGA
jgi:hypothetical protein